MSTRDSRTRVTGGHLPLTTNRSHGCPCDLLVVTVDVTYALPFPSFHSSRVMASNDDQYQLGTPLSTKSMRRVGGVLIACRSSYSGDPHSFIVLTFLDCVAPLLLTNGRATVREVPLALDSAHCGSHCEESCDQPPRGPMDSIAAEPARPSGPG